MPSSRMCPREKILRFSSPSAIQLGLRRDLSSRSNRVTVDAANERSNSSRPSELDRNLSGLIAVLFLALPVSADGRTIRIDDKNWGLIDFPGGRTKFTICFDPVSARYWSLVNKQSDPAAERNVLALVSSSDLKRWKVHTIVLQHPDRRHHAWQYVDWRFEGDDIVAVSRTAWGDSHNFHDANYLTFHRINDFRRLVY